MAITDLTGTVWYLNSSPSSTLTIKSINFYSNSKLWNSIACDEDQNYQNYYYSLLYGSTIVYDDASYDGWRNVNYKKIYIVDGIDVTDSTLISWLQTNAALITTSNEYITYANDMNFVAQAIRAKGNTSSGLNYPLGFVTAIQNIPTGASSYTLLHSGTTTVSNYTSTSATTHVTINAGAGAFTSNSILYVKIRDTAGMRAGHFLGSDSYCFNYQAANGSTSNCTYWVKNIHREATGGTLSTYTAGTSIGYGLYPYSVASNGNINIYKRYNSSYSLTIDGTYSIEVYLLDYKGNPFDFKAGISI